jgi:hypothetical protein
MTYFEDFVIGSSFTVSIYSKYMNTVGKPV